MTAKRLENLLNPSKDGDLAHIVRRARDMGDLASALSRMVSPEEGASILAANIRDDGPAWASRLRFSADVLLEAARAHGAEASRCTVRVARNV